MLQTDKLVQKAYTGTLQTTLQKLVPQIWAAELEKNLRIAKCLQESVINNTDLMVPGAGDTLYMPSLPDLPAMSDLTEGTDMAVTTLSTATSVPYTPTERGMLIGVTRKALDRIKYDGASEIIDRLGYAVTLKVEGMIAALWNATVPSVGGSLTQVYANGKTSANILATDVFNDDLILAGKQQMMVTNNVPYPDGMWRLYISPKQYRNLLNDANTRNDLRYAVPGQLIRGEVGVIHNTRIIVTNFVNSQTENTVNVFDALLMAPRWAAIAWKRQPEIFVDPTFYDGGRRRQFGVTADFDVQLLHNERAVVLKSA